MALPWSRTAALISALVTCAVPAAAALRPPVQVSIIRSKASVEFGAWERGHLRMYLEQNGYACMLARKRPEVSGELSLALDVTAGQPVRVTLTDTKKLRPPSFPTCLKEALKRVGFATLAPRFQWEGTLRYEPTAPFEVGVTSLYSKKMMELEMQHVVIAALEQPAPCIERFFSAKPELSVVLTASFDVTLDGALTNLEVKLSTGGPDDIAACVKDQLSALAFPPGQLSGARLRVALLRPTSASSPHDGPVLMGR